MMPTLTHQRFVILNRLIHGPIEHEVLLTLIESDGVVIKHKNFRPFMERIANEWQLHPPYIKETNGTWEITDYGRVVYNEIVELYKRLLCS